MGEDGDDPELVLGLYDPDDDPDYLLDYFHSIEHAEQLLTYSLGLRS